MQLFHLYVGVGQGFHEANFMVNLLASLRLTFIFPDDIWIPILFFFQGKHARKEIITLNNIQHVTRSINAKGKPNLQIT